MTNDPDWDEDERAGPELRLARGCMVFTIDFEAERIEIHSDTVAMHEEQIRRFCAKVVDAFNEVGNGVPV